MNKTNEEFPATFEGLMTLVRRLRGPKGCPWDRDQTSQSMRRHLLEESYELIEAIDEGDAAKLKEELGDVLFHLAFQVHLGGEGGSFGEPEVFRSVIDKLVRRHPHVFGDESASSPDEAISRWDAVKTSERGGAPGSILDTVPKASPALFYAQVLQERAARIGFDWEDVQGVLGKVAEELEELRDAETAEQREGELGDILFSIVNLSRWLDLDAEAALRGADERFRRRFQRMEQLSRDGGASLGEMSLDGKEALWQQAKGQVG